MIGQIRGTLILKKPPLLLIDVNGIGYEVNASMHTIYALPNLNYEVTLLTHFIVKEDSQSLYGFFEEKERIIFRELIKVSGVGPKLALTILSGMNLAAFCQCVQQKDHNKLVAIPGIGPKTAEKLVLEMHHRLKKQLLNNINFNETILSGANLTNPNNKESENLNNNGKTSSQINNLIAAQTDAINALISLGYKPADAEKAINNVTKKNQSDSIDNFMQNEPKEINSETLIKFALQEFAK